MRQEEAIGLNDVSLDSHASALQLLVVGVPALDHAAFSLNTVGGLDGFEPVQAALVVPLLANVSEAAGCEEEEKREQK